MYDFKNVLFEHWKKYPLMQIQDAVKLIYQSEFGGEHLSSDYHESLNRILEETDSAQKQSFELFESLGDKISRLNLSATKNKYESKAANRMFFYSAENFVVNKSTFNEKLNILVQIAKEKAIPFARPEVEDYINDYFKNGIYAVHHSNIYKYNYSPSYRVVANKYTPYFHLISKIEYLLSKQNKVVIAIDGMAGSGKSTLAEILSELFSLDTIHLDHFFLPPQLRTDERFCETGGNIHYERFSNEVLANLRTSKAFTYKIFDCSVMDFKLRPAKVNKKIILCEGSYSMHPRFIENYDITVATKCSSQTQQRRILERNGKDFFERYINEWIPMENKYFMQTALYENADFLFTTD